MTNEKIITKARAAQIAADFNPKGIKKKDLPLAIAQAILNDDKAPGIHVKADGKVSAIVAQGKISIEKFAPRGKDDRWQISILEPGRHLYILLHGGIDEISEYYNITENPSKFGHYIEDRKR